MHLRVNLQIFNISKYARKFSRNNIHLLQRDLCLEYGDLNAGFIQKDHIFLEDGRTNSKLICTCMKLATAWWKAFGYKTRKKRNSVI